LQSVNRRGRRGANPQSAPRPFRTAKITAGPVTIMMQSSWIQDTTCHNAVSGVHGTLLSDGPYVCTPFLRTTSQQSPDILTSHDIMMTSLDSYSTCSLQLKVAASHLRYSYAFHLSLGLTPLPLLALSVRSPPRQHLSTC
jgi:hypothetical protein